MESANNNVRMCELALAEELYTESAFNAQQAAEKSLKAYLLYRNESIIFTHNLLYLQGRCEKFDEAFTQLNEECRILNAYYTSARYPDMNNSFDAYTEEVASEALRLARNVLEFVEARMV